ncbi:MAG: type II and III secretion system protein family protein [Roseiarcus sp.]|jgi:pilus assembly protein CpaC
MAKSEFEVHCMTGHRAARRAARRAALPIAALLALVALGPQTAALSGQAAAISSLTLADGSVTTLQLGVGRSVIVDLPEDAAEIFVGQPKVANAVVRSARRIYVSTLWPGQTSIFALAADGRKIAVLQISVGRDVGELATLLNASIPGNDIHVRTVAESIILTGSVASAGDAQKALDIASGFLSETKEATQGGDGKQVQGKVVNSLTIRGLDQVSLRVTVTEIRRDIVKQLGVNMQGVGKAPNSFQIDNPFSVNGGGLGGATAALGWLSAGKSLTATLEAYERDGVARTLAEPTVTAVSGESAKFLAGGTIPILNGESCSGNVCTPTIVQQPYGVTLNFTPVVLSQGRIQLRIATEVTDVDTSTQITIFGAPVPGFRTRKNETTVELPSGGSIVTAGLISTKTQQAINGVPGLMNLPVLGALFRSRDYLRDETELLIAVTPYIVHAVDPREVARPDANYTDASDPQSWLLGRVNRIYSSTGAAQPTPGYSGKVGFITD